jgi:hypothetical protein
MVIVIIISFPLLLSWAAPGYLACGLETLTPSPLPSPRALFG